MFSINDAGESEYPNAKERSWTLTLHQQFSTSAPPEVLKHVTCDSLVRGTDLF